MTGQCMFVKALPLKNTKGGKNKIASQVFFILHTYAIKYIYPLLITFVFQEYCPLFSLCFAFRVSKMKTEVL